MTKKSILVITPGDPKGIGPEITWKAIRSGLLDQENIALLCIGAREPFEALQAPIKEVPIDADTFEPPPGTHSTVWLLPAPHKAPPGLSLEGFQSGWSIQHATRLVLNGFASALVTGPISKDHLQKGGYHYPGHTEFLAHLCSNVGSNVGTNSASNSDNIPGGTPEVTMMLANELLRVSLVTTHLGIHEVSASITRGKIKRAVMQTIQGLKSFWGLDRPKIAVTALNPHAGENGLFGKEEIDIIEPEIQSLNQASQGQFQVSGPFPADTFFAKQLLTPVQNRFDAVVCMYHDQGLIPVKLLDFHNTVNVTLGLPIIRTSVDHGVGFDIAGKGIANPSSLLAAIKLATRFIQKRNAG